MRLPLLPHLGRTFLTTIAGVAAGGLFAVAPALAAGSTISVAPATAAAGQTVVISGSVPVTGDGSGAFRANYRVPATTAAGTYEIGLRCGGGNVGVHTTLRVTAPAPPAPGIAVTPARVRAGHTVVISGTVPTTGEKSCPVSDTA